MTEKAITQSAQVLAALKNGESLTPLDALDRFGTFRLGAIIFNLRKAGHNIKTDLIWNGRNHYASYSLIDE